MTRETFLEKVKCLSAYNEKELQLEEILNIDCLNFVYNMISDMGDTLIIAVNPDLIDSEKDYFYETFWNNINNKVNESTWRIFYDRLSTAPQIVNSMIKGSE